MQSQLKGTEDCRSSQAEGNQLGRQTALVPKERRADLVLIRAQGR